MGECGKDLWQRSENDIPNIFTQPSEFQLIALLGPLCPFLRAQRSPLVFTSQKHQPSAPPFAQFVRAKAACVQTLWPGGCTGKQKIALNSDLTLRRMPFNQRARCSKGPIIALID